MTATITSRSEKLRDIAAKLRDKARDFGRSRSENTPKQQAQAASARLEAHRHSYAADAAEALANYLEELGSDDPRYAQFKSASAILDATKCKSKSVQNGFHPYSIAVADDFYDMSLNAMSLRSLVSDTEGHNKVKQSLKLQELLARAKNSSIPGFFPSPEPVVDAMLDMVTLFTKATVLEPSAGIGSIAEAVKKQEPTAIVACIEQQSLLCEILQAKGLTVLNNDFLSTKPSYQFDIVLMNPPFENDLAITHIQHAYQFLIAGGELVSVLPGNYAFYATAQRKKRSDFAKWTNSMRSEWQQLPEGSFKGAFKSTGVNTSLLRLVKDR